MSVSLNMPVDRFPRRVSFNNLDPEPAPAAREVDFSDYTLGYGASVVNDISKIYSSSYTRLRKRRRSAAPAKPILKNKLSPQQLRYNISNAASLGINYHQELDDLGSSDDDDADELDVKKPPPGRRKSYSDMTDDELMALDPQFANTKTNLDKFKFDSVSTYYRPERKASAVSAVAPGSAVELPKSHNYKGISLTRQHDKFVDRRTLLTVVSGRRHTWNSIDWLAKSDFLDNGDFLVVSALVPAKYSNKPDMLHKRCQRLLDYVVQSLTKELSLKITVEFVLHEEATNGLKTMIKNLFLYYSPHMLILGNRGTSLNFKYPIKMKESTVGNYLVKLASYLIKYSTVPVILVGNNTAVVPQASRKGSYVSEMESIASSSSADAVACSKHVSYTAFDAYQTMVQQISDKSLDQSREYLKQLKHHQEQDEANKNQAVPQIKFDDSVTFDSKIHSIYNSQLGKSTSGNSERMYKVKSLFESDKSEKAVQSQSSDSSNTLDKNSSAGEKLTLKQIKSSLKKEPPKKAPEKKKSLWKKIF